MYLGPEPQTFRLLEYELKSDMRLDRETGLPMREKVIFYKDKENQNNSRAGI